MPSFGFGFGLGLGLTRATGGGGSAPTNTVAPVISGTTTQGSVLTTTTGTWTNGPTGYSYQWYSGGLPVGTNANAYTLVAGDVGHLITVLVTAANAGGSNSAPSAAVGPVTGSGGGTQRVLADGVTVRVLPDGVTVRVL